MFWAIDSNSNSKCTFSRTRTRGDIVEKHWSHWSQSQNREHIGSLRFISGFITPMLRIGELECPLESLESKWQKTPIFDVLSNATDWLHWSQLKGAKPMPSDWSLYPDNWKEIAARCKAEAGYKCQECGAPNGVWIFRHLTDRKKYMDWGDEAEMYWNGEDYEDKAVLVQLGVAHLDQNPANNNPSNLKVLCRRCHLVYDLPFHVIKARKTRLNKKQQAKLASGQLLMFQEVEPCS